MGLHYRTVIALSIPKGNLFSGHEKPRRSGVGWSQSVRGDRGLMASDQERAPMTDSNEPTDPFEIAYRAIRQAQREGRPIPKIRDLVPQRR